MTLLAIIPARGGSKGIPKKNIAPLGGKPLIVHTLEAAQGSTMISEIFVSTDEEEIAACCEAVGVSVPYRRPASLATADAKTADAVVDALNWLVDTGRPYEGPVIVLQPTSPFRLAEDIDNAAKVFLASGAESLISVHTMTEHPFNCVEETPEGLRLLATSPKAPLPRQQFPDNFFVINGAIYIATQEFAHSERALFREHRSIPYKMDPARGIDIDTIEDLRLAEAILGDTRGLKA